jgi:hypothetical protein
MACVHRILIRQFATGRKWNDCKLTATTGFQVDAKEFGVDFDQIGVPSISRDSNVFIALFSLISSAIDMTCMN